VGLGELRLRPKEIVVDSWVLREATEADAGTLLALVRAAFEEFRGRLDPPSGAHAETLESVYAAVRGATSVGHPVRPVSTSEEQGRSHRLA